MYKSKNPDGSKDDRLQVFENLEIVMLLKIISKKSLEKKQNRNLS